VNAATQPARCHSTVPKRFAGHDYTERDRLILEHLSLVRAIAGHVQKSIPVHIELDDLVHAGTMGLFDAATKYREDREVSFAIYAKHRIRGAILDSLRQMDCASRDLRKRQKQMETVTRELTAKLGRTPLEAEIAEAMGLNNRQWQCLMVDLRSIAKAATQQKASEDQDQLPPDPPSSPADAPDRVFARTELRARLGSALSNLSARQQKVMKLYYEGDYTMRQIGGMLGVNESRVSQIHKSALARMQSALAERGIHSAAAF
jgi:RNA polymerase sigma factor for flagellar operon FliA